MQGSRCQKVREPSTAGLILDAFASGSTLWGSAQGWKAGKTALTNRKATLLVVASLCPSENILENGIVRWLFRKRGEGKSFEIDQQCRREKRLEPSWKGLIDRQAFGPCARGHPSSMASHDYLLVFSGLPWDLEQEASRTLFLNFCSNFYSKKTSHFLYILAIKVCFELAVTPFLEGGTHLIKN